MTTVPSTTAPRTVPGRARPPVSVLLALAGSAATALVGVWWLLAPTTHPLADQLLVVLQFLSPTLAAAGLVGLGVVTLALGVAALVFPPVRPVTTAAGLVAAALLIIAYQGASLIMLSGYLVAMSVPVGLLVVITQVLRRCPRLRPVVVVLVAGVVAWGVAMNVFDSSAPLLRLVTTIAPLVGPQLLAQAIPALVLGTAAAWLAASWNRIKPTATAGRAARFVRERRTVFTLIAAACPLPYVLLRLTWLTPFQQFSPPDMSPELRLWGLLLGSAAIVGSVLTVGLIRPWGEVFPRWMPVLAGREVPIAAAAVPGFVVSAVLGGAAVSMLFSQFPGSGLTLTETLFTALVFPFWLWAPTLTLAVAGYVGHRRSTR